MDLNGNGENRLEVNCIKYKFFEITRRFLAARSLAIDAFVFATPRGDGLMILRERITSEKSQCISL